MIAFKTIFLTLLASCVAASLHAQKTTFPEPTERRIYKIIGDTKLELWIYKPADWKSTDQRSAIVFYHGGGWRSGNPSAFSRQCEKLAARGMLAISVQYRLTSQAGTKVEDCVKDARSAFRWVTAQATALGIDSAKIAAGGGSAGGHLAASLVTLDSINDVADDLNVAIKPAALVLFNPAVKLDFPKARENRTEEEYAAMMKLNPYQALKAGHPPAIIFHGSADRTVPLQTVQDYAAKVKELGGICEVSVFEGRDHAFFNKEPDVWETLKQAGTFLQKQGL